MTNRAAEAYAISGGDAGGLANYARFVRDPTSWRTEALRYAVSAALAALVGAFVIVAFGTNDHIVEATDTERAVLVDLPAALSSSQPVSEAPEGPQQEASEAAPAAPPDPPQERPPVVDPMRMPPPMPTEPPKIVDPPIRLAQPELDVTPPVEDMKPAEPTFAPPKDKPKPQDAKQESKPDEPKPVETPTGAPSPAMAEQAPAGSNAPVAGEQPENDEGRAHASPRAITAWQRSLVGRLETAKRQLPRGITRTATGTVQIAFAVDRDGRVVSERVAHSSGSTSLDDTALSLVRRAAPFPTPPNGAGDRDLSFIVPIRFRH